MTHPTINWHADVVYRVSIKAVYGAAEDDASTERISRVEEGSFDACTLSDLLVDIAEHFGEPTTSIRLLRHTPGRIEVTGVLENCFDEIASEHDVERWRDEEITLVRCTYGLNVYLEYIVRPDLVEELGDSAQQLYTVVPEEEDDVLDHQ